MKPYFERKSGLEFGGPSSIFAANNLIPIYNIASAVDNCDFASRNIWTRREKRRGHKSDMRKPLIAEAAEPSEIPDESYDFVASSHVLEHVANPLRALSEWKRILKPSGIIVVVVPHKAGMFDHRRPFTTFDHVLADFESNVTETDLTHLEEIVALHDLTLDPPAGSREQFRKRCLQNASSRAMHHHVFSPGLLVDMFSLMEMRVLNVTVERPYHIVVFAQKAAYPMNANTFNKEQKIKCRF
jgi:SAM-dependent methyltransferase